MDLVAVEPQVLDLLQYLILKRDHVVSKDELIAAVWNGRIVSESALSSRITAVRHAIGDSGEQQGLIRTFARKGFRFVGEVWKSRLPTKPIQPNHCCKRPRSRAERRSLPTSRRLPSCHFRA